MKSKAYFLKSPTMNVRSCVNLKLNSMMEGISGEIAKQLFNKLLIPFAIVFAIGFALGAWLF